MVCSHSFAGVAPGRVAQSRGDGVWLRKQSAQALPALDDDPGLPARLPRGGLFPLRTRSAYGGKRPRRRALSFNGARLSGIALGSAADRFPEQRSGADQKSPASRRFCRRHCGPCAAACAPPIAGRAALQTTLPRLPDSVPDSALLTPRSAAIFHLADSGAACPPEFCSR